MSTVVWLPEQSHHRAEFGPFWGKPEQEDGPQGVRCIKTQAPCLSFSKVQCPLGSKLKRSSDSC